MTSGLWNAAAALADALAATPHFTVFRRAFEDASRQSSLAHRVGELTARYSPLRSHPELLGVRLNMLPETEQLLLGPADHEWLERAVECGTSVQVLVEALRSRLPRYPMLRVPHLRPGSPHVLDNPFVFRGFPWDAEIRRMGLQLQPWPTMTALGGGDLSGLLSDVYAALRVRESWLAFDEAAAALTADDVSALGPLGKEFSALIRPEAVNAEAGDLLLPRHAYRVAALQETVDRATGRVGAYLRAFEDVDELITIVASFMGTQIKNGHLMEMVPRRMALGGGGDVRDVDLVVAGDLPFLSPTETIVLLTGDETVGGVVYPTSITHKWGRLDDPEASRMVIVGRLAL